MLESFHDGPLPSEGSYADDGGGQVVVTVLKAAEDGDGYVVRAYEAAGSDAEVTMELPLLGRTLPLAFAAGEIKTVVVPADASLPVRETNLLEL